MTRRAAARTSTAWRCRAATKGLPPTARAEGQGGAGTGGVGEADRAGPPPIFLCGGKSMSIALAVTDVDASGTIITVYGTVTPSGNYATGGDTLDWTTI